MILVDTSVWVDHLRKGVPALVTALEEGRVLMHPFILGELACGNLHNRTKILIDLSLLPAAPVATDLEVLEFVERRALMGQGIGYLDVHLLASTALSPPTRIWTRDKRLLTMAARLGLGHGGTL